MLFADLGPRQVVAEFSGGCVSSDGGLLLWRELDRALGLTRQLSRCFQDHRDLRFIEHSVAELLAQRLLALAAGYEDLNDHQRLRADPLLAVAAGKADPLGEERAQPEQLAKPLAATATLNRLELTNTKPDSRYHKIVADHAAIAALLLTLGVGTLDPQQREVIVDVDTTGVLLHGLQQGRHFSSYHGGYCYVPLLVFVGAVPLWAELRTGDADAARGVPAVLAQVVAAIWRRCPQARIIVRGDSEFAREEIMAWCEQPRAAAEVVYYCFGLGRNTRLMKNLADARMHARARACLTGGTARVFAEFLYQTRETWSRSRRVVGKAEVVAGQDKPRWIVTNLPREGFGDEPSRRERFGAQACYEQLYCARGGMENQIKEQQLDLFGTRLSTHWLATNQLRLWFSAFAQYLTERLRTLALRDTALAAATADTLRTRLLKVGVVVTVSVRRVCVQLASAFPLQELFCLAWRRLRALPTAAG